MAALTVETPTNTLNATRQASRQITRNVPDSADDANWLLREQAIVVSSTDPVMVDKCLLASRALEIAELHAQIVALVEEIRTLREAQQITKPRMRATWAPRILAHMQAHPEQLAWTADEIRAALEAPYSLAKQLRDMVTKDMIIGSGGRFLLAGSAELAKQTTTKTQRARERKAAA